MRGTSPGIKRVDWATWFAVLSPFIGALVGALSVFVLTR
jgi:hypothetical protein